MSLWKMNPAVTRRSALAWIGMAGASLIGSLRRETSFAQCLDTPPQTEGPYWVDERLQRSDIRVDPSDGSVEPGVPLRLRLNVLRADQNCSPAAGIQVDVWHCDAEGLYSDEAANGTVGRKFLRGYQISDDSGAVQFTTVYPGWYPGRTIHIHFRVRTFDGTTTTYDFTSQVYFDDSISDAVMAQAPYNARGARVTNNDDDNIFDSDTLLTLDSDGSGGYVGTYDIALNGLPDGAPSPLPTASFTPTGSPQPNPTQTAAPAVPCTGDCNADEQVTVNELVTLVNTALGHTSAASCPNGIPSDTEVDIAFLVRAVNSVLNGCA